MIYAAAYSLLAFWTLWIFFLAVMGLKRAQKEGKLSLQGKIFGYPVVAVGYALDVVVNTIVMTVIVVELPQWQLGEWTVSERLKRYRKKGGSGWQVAVAGFFVSLLNPYDIDEEHI